MLSILGLSQNWTSLIVLLALIALIWLFDRKNFKRDGIIFMRRTKKGLRFINSFAKKHEKFFRAFGTLGVILSFGVVGEAYVIFSEKKKSFLKASAVFVFFLAALLVFVKPYAAAIVALLGASGFILLQLILGVVGIFSLQTTSAPLQLVLPVQTTAAPVFFVPIDFWLISIFVVMIVHEFAHAFVARAENIRVKSIGYGFAAILPLGFAEPDEAQLKRTGTLKKSRVFAAGSFSNVITGIISLLLFAAFLLLSSALFVPAGIAYSATIMGSPAHNVLPESGTITAINGNQVADVGRLASVMDNITAGSKVSVDVSGKSYEITAAQKDNTTKAFMGISDMKNALEAKKQFAPFIGDTFSAVLLYLISLFRWLFMLNVGVGIANLLPLKPLDGGFLFEEITKKFFPKSWKAVYAAVAMTTLGLIILNLFGVYLVRAVV